jgi:hypothetical protein
LAGRLHASHNPVATSSLWLLATNPFCYLTPGQWSRNARTFCPIKVGLVVGSDKVASNSSALRAAAFDFGKFHPASKSKVYHIIHIKHRDEVEAPITDWLREAYELSDVLAPKASTTRAKSKRKPKSNRISLR